MAIAVITSFQQISDADGVPYNGAKVYVYAAGTTTPLSVYSDPALTVAAANPIICNAAGQHPMRYIATASYKVLVTDADEAPLTDWSKDNIDPGVSIGSGALPVANGGTGATTAPAARTSLGAAAATDMATAQSDISNLQTWAGYTLTTRTRIAAGTTAQRPTAGIVSVRYNSETGYFEADNGSAWANLMRQGQALPADFATGSGRFMLQRVRVTELSNASGTTQCPFDSTNPQITEGTEAFTGTITPKSASSLIKVKVLLHYSVNASGTVTAHLHKNSALSSISGVSGSHQASEAGSLVFEYEESPGNTTAINYSVICGPSTSATVTFNGSNTLGGIVISALEIEEWLAP